MEYNEYKFETRDEAVIASLRPFITKLASAVTAVLTSATYLLFDVTSYTNQISSLEQQCTQGLITESEKLDLISGVLSSTTSLQSTGLLLCMSLLPCAMMLLSYFPVSYTHLARILMLFSKHWKKQQIRTAAELPFF